MISGHGPEFSPLMIVGDYPSKPEVEKNRAFSGYTGKTIDEFLRVNGFSLEKCYRTLLYKTPLLEFGTKNVKRRADILKQANALGDWEKILIDEIKGIDPNSILAVGELAMNFLTGETGIYRFRGSVLPARDELNLSKKLKIIPVHHPRDIQVKPIIASYTPIDFAKACRLKNDSSVYKEPGNLWICRDATSLINYWKRAKSGSFLTFDIETHNNFATCIGFCTDGDEAISVPLLDRKISIPELECLWRKIIEILKSPIPKVNQNIKYDWTVLERFGITINNIIGDTMLMAHTIYPELKKGLDFLTSIYTDMSYYKDEGKEYNPKIANFDKMLFYNAKDCLSTWKVWHAQQNDADEMGVKHFYFNKIHPLLFHYKKMSDRGILTDFRVKFALMEKYQAILGTHHANIERAYGKPLNIQSPKQVAIFVYEYLECPKIYHTNPLGEKILSTHEDTLTELYLNRVQDDFRRMLLKEISLCRKIKKILEFLDTPIHYDDRFRTSFKLEGTVNGRTSSSTAIGGYYIRKKGKIERSDLGASIGTIPKRGFEFEDIRYGHDVRTMFVPTPGYMFIEADGKNAEGHVVCVLAEDWSMLEYMLAGNDVHRLTASWIYPKPLQYIKPDEREVGKMARHAGNLGQTAAGLAIKTFKHISVCKKILEKFHTNAPNVREVFHRGIYNLLRNNGNNRHLINPFGRRRDFLNKLEKDEDGLDFLPQSSVSDHYKFASVRVLEHAPYAHQLAEIHDSLFWEIPIEKRDEFIPIVQRELSVPINFSECSLKRAYNLVIPVEISESYTNWKEMKQIETKVEVRNIA